MTTVFIISLKSPHCAIRTAECRLIQRKWTWAEDFNGERHLLGSSAFYTLASAQRARLGALRKVQANTYLKGFHPYQWKAANDALMQEAKVLPLRRHR